MAPVDGAGADPRVEAREAELKANIKRIAAEMPVMFFILIPPFSTTHKDYVLKSCLREQSSFLRSLLAQVIPTLQPFAVLSSHLNCGLVGLLQRRVPAPTMETVVMMESVVPDENSTARQKEES